jgi:hypothetical protein
MRRDGPVLEGTVEELAAILERLGMETASLRPMEESKDDIALLTVPGEEALPSWRRLRARVEETGHWPVLLGDDEDLDLHIENVEEYEEPEGKSQVGAVLRAADRIDFTRWYTQQTRGGLESVLGAWPAQVGAEPAGDAVFTIPRDVLTRDPAPRVHVALVPTPRHWEVPAYLRFGGFNACPSPDEHVAIWRRWHETYGAELVGISHDVVEALVSRPPTDREGAMQLAQEQYAYCDDIVSQGCGSISELAARLLDRPTWYFWWD